MSEYWEYSTDTKPTTDEMFASEDAALDAAEDELATDVIDHEDPKNGQVFRRTITVYQFRERVHEDVLESATERVIEYEHYHGDLEEYGSY